MISYKKHCARCKEVTVSSMRHETDYIEFYCTVCDGPSKRVTYETAWNRIMAALSDIPEEESHGSSQ